MIKKNSRRSAWEVQGINVAAKWQILLLEIFAFLRRKSNICLVTVICFVSTAVCVMWKGFTLQAVVFKRWTHYGYCWSPTTTIYSHSAFEILFFLNVFSAPVGNKVQVRIAWWQYSGWDHWSWHLWIAHFWICSKGLGRIIASFFPLFYFFNCEDHKSWTCKVCNWYNLFVISLFCSWTD